MGVAAGQHSLRTDELDYELPEALIATQPAEPRDSARMLVMWRSHSRVEHRHVRDLPEYLNRSDVLVFNNTSVLPARILGRRNDTGGGVEGLFLNEVQLDEGHAVWRVMLKSGGRLKSGYRIELLGHQHESTGLSLVLKEKTGGEWIVRLDHPTSTSEALAKVGWTPLPPYILHARGDHEFADTLDRQWYQTVYADPKLSQSVAAPTAGLHFTPQLLESLQEKGVERIDVTLHVGPGTFKPIAAETLDGHRMHTEKYDISALALDRLKAVVNRRLRRSAQPEEISRVIAVGTTTVRTLESLPPNWPQIYGSIGGMTDLLIAPPYEFKHIDGMLTNFHLPRSTLLALVAAMVGLDRLKNVYREAIELGYRFYSYGDAMLILP